MPVGPAPRPLVVVTGAGRGVGFATALALVRTHRAQVIAVSRDVSAWNAVKEEGITPLTADVATEEGRATVVRAVDGRPLAGLINNAGLGTQRKLVDMSDDEWHKVLDVTLTGTFRMMRAMLPHMQKRGRGAIVNNSSVLGWRAQKEQAHYAAAKAGVMALTRCAGLEAAEHGVRINAVAPSIALHAFLKKSASEELLAQLTGREAFGRAAEVWEVANVMMFLASDYASYLVGEVISVSSQHA